MKEISFDAVYYEPESLNYELGRQLEEKFAGVPWIPIESHNSIKEMQEKPNSEFGRMKRNLIVGIRKTHKYTENHKVSDYLVYVHRAINGDAFPKAPDLYQQELMIGRGRGRYCYRPEARAEAEEFLRREIRRVLGDTPILYIS